MCAQHRELALEEMLLEGLEGTAFACGASFEVEEGILDVVPSDEIVEVRVRLRDADEKEVVEERDDGLVDFGRQICEHFAR
jgi:hypothetical protein